MTMGADDNAAYARLVRAMRERKMNNNREIEQVVFRVNDAEFTFVHLSAGYGCDEMWLAKTHTTVGQWNAIMAEERREEPANWPVTNVNFDDVRKFCARLSRRVGGGFRLPTEAEYCRALGAEPERLEDYAVFGQSECCPVGTKLPNEHGLDDMHGLAWHWLGRRKHNERQPSRLRGGSWGGDHISARAVHSLTCPPSFSYEGLGFRVMADNRPPSEAAPEMK
jgi:formylglycine-generating enzyme required for sulfatase activity